GPPRPPVPHRPQLAVRDVRPDPPPAPVDQLLALRHERVNQPRPRRLRQRVPAGLPDRHVPGDRLRVAPGQLRRRPGRSREVKRLENLHDLPARLGHGSLRTPMGKANHLKPTHTGGTTHITTRRKPAKRTGRTPGPSTATGLEKRWPPTWS